MGFFDFFKKEKEVEDDLFEFSELKPLDVKNNPIVQMRKEQEKLKEKFNVHTEKKGKFLDLK